MNCFPAFNSKFIGSKYYVVGKNKKDNGRKEQGRREQPTIKEMHDFNQRNRRYWAHYWRLYVFTTSLVLLTASGIYQSKCDRSCKGNITVTFEPTKIVPNEVKQKCRRINQNEVPFTGVQTEVNYYESKGHEYAVLSCVTNHATNVIRVSDKEEPSMKDFINKTLVIGGNFHFMAKCGKNGLFNGKLMNGVRMDILGAICFKL